MISICCYRASVVAAVTLTLLFPATRVAADSPAIAEHPGISIQMDLQAFADSEIGAKLIQDGAKIAAAEFGEDRDYMSALKESLGFDPLSQIAKIRVMIGDLEDPTSEMHVMVSMVETTGNLEGLLLAAPGYESLEENGKAIHSISLDGQQAFLGFAEGDGGEKRVLASTSKGSLMEMLSAGSKSPVAKALQWKVPAGQFLMVSPSTFPNEIIQETPLKNILPLIEDVFFTIGQVDDSFQASLKLSTVNDEKSAQIKQLTQGVIAMASLFEQEIREEIGDAVLSDAAIKTLKSIEVKRTGQEVSVEIEIPSSLVMRFLRETGLPL